MPTSYLSALAIDEQTGQIQDAIWCIFSVDDVTIINEPREGVINKIERWKEFGIKKG